MAMQQTAQEKSDDAFDKVIGWLEHFEDLEDPRQNGKVLYPLNEVLLLVLLAVIAGAEGWTEAALYGRQKLEFLRRFAPFEDGTPSHDSLGEIFAALDAEQFQSCFISWVGEVTKLGPDIVAIDGKTLRRAYQERGAKAIHMISAWASRQRLVLGQRQVDAKSNEITAIPEMLDLLTLKGSIITIDAMGCQKEIAAKIVAKGADYVLALKGNQSALRDDVVTFYNEQKACVFTDCVASQWRTIEKSHGRIETRTYTAIADPGWLQDRHGWPGFKGFVVVDSTREMVDGKVERETRFYITSLPSDAGRLGEAVRSHWGVESHHWVMDVVFRDDECRIRTANAPANFATVKHMAANLLRRASGKESLRAKRKLAAWDDAYLERVIRG
jgi:predicted transposase YbfD/YdcC